MQVAFIIIIVIAIVIAIVAIVAIVAVIAIIAEIIAVNLNFKMVRYTDGSVAQGWVKEGAWHGVYRSG